MGSGKEPHFARDGPNLFEGPVVEPTPLVQDFRTGQFLVDLLESRLRESSGFGWLLWITLQQILL